MLANYMDATNTWTDRERLAAANWASHLYATVPLHANLQ